MLLSIKNVKFIPEVNIKLLHIELATAVTKHFVSIYLGGTHKPEAPFYFNHDPC